VLTCSFGGQRTPIDIELLGEARDFLTEKAKAQRIVGAHGKIAAPAARSMKEIVEAIDVANVSTIRVAVDAAIADARDSVVKTAQSASVAYEDLQKDTIRLAEEVDMLWWHIGDWSEKLGRSRTELPERAVGLVSGIELGRFVRDLPGPLGAFGVLRRTLAKQSETKIKLDEAVESLGDDVGKIALEIPNSAMAVYPVHAAIQLASQYGRDTWQSKFDAQVGLLKEFELSNFDLSVQAFRERSLLKNLGLGE
jgi:hypothetical protein